MALAATILKCDSQTVIKFHGLAALPYRWHNLASHAIFSLELLSCRQENPCHTLAYEHCHTLSSHTFITDNKAKTLAAWHLPKTYCFRKDTKVSCDGECLGFVIRSALEKSRLPCGVAFGVPKCHSAAISRFTAFREKRPLYGCS